MKKIGLQLFVIGPSVFSRVAVRHANEMIKAHPQIAFELDVIDILEDPQAAETHKILATPTLLKTHPEPTCRIIGDLSDRNKISYMLGLHRLQDYDEEKLSISQRGEGS